MPRQAVFRARLTHRLLSLAIVLLPACSPLTPPPMSQGPKLSLSSVEYRYTVRFPTDRAEMGSNQVAALRAFVASLPAGQRLDGRVLAQANGRVAGKDDVELPARRAARVAEELRRSGIDEVEIATVAFGDRWPARPSAGNGIRQRDHWVEVRITGTEVNLPGCPDWSRDPGFDPLNLPLSNLGCANAHNLGLMVADPADLLPRRALAPADGTREAEAIVRYRTDKVKQIEADIIQ
jgi:pilus biogenesis lipoprotein CpaD